MINVENLKPFPKFCYTIGMIPTSYKESLTYEEQLMWFCDFLQNTVIPTVNNNGQAVQELQNLYVQLKNYVDNYFENLDVQTEINNKLDEMAENGTLTEIISSYLNAKAIFAFNNVEEMKNSENLIEGSFAETLGYYAKNDGGKSLYKIRKITNEDVIDNATIIPIGSNDLIAELIAFNKIDIMQLGAKGDGTSDDTSIIKLALQKFNYVVLSKVHKINENIVVSNFNENYNKTLKIIGKLILNNCNLRIIGTNVYITGNGIISGYSQDALVVFGATENNQDVNCVNCTVEKLKLITTTPGIGVIFRNYNKGDLFGCYCNTLQNIYVENCITAVKLIGDANANVINNINMMSYAENVKEMFCFEGLSYNNVLYAPIENIFSDCFYFHGENTPMIRFKSSVQNRSYRNVFSTFTCEQFGNNSLFIDVEENALPQFNSFINISSNTLLGYYTLATKQILDNGKNTFITVDNAYLPLLNTNILKSKTGFEGGLNNNMYENIITFEASENTNIKLFNSSGITPTGISPKGKGATIEVIITEQKSGIPILQHAEKILLFLNNTDMNVIEQSNTSDSRFSISDFDLFYKTGNNGTSLNDVNITVYYKITCYNGEARYMLKDLPV